VSIQCDWNWKVSEQMAIADVMGGFDDQRTSQHCTNRLLLEHKRVCFEAQDVIIQLQALGCKSADRK
jgi:hypothetical protein